jgi:hypothetical protein
MSDRVPIWSLRHAESEPADGAAGAVPTVPPTVHPHRAPLRRSQRARGMRYAMWPVHLAVAGPAVVFRLGHGPRCPAVCSRREMTDASVRLV